MYNPQLETFLRVVNAGSFNKAAEIKLSADEVTALDYSLEHIKMSAVFGGSKIVK